MTCFAVVFEDSCWVLVDRWYCRPNSRLRQFRRWSEQAHGHGLEVLNDGGEMELVAGAGKAAQPHAFESMMRLQVGKAHLDPLPLIARFQEGLRLHLAASDVAGRLVDVPHNPARGHVRTASLLQRALPAARHGCEVSDRMVAVDPATGRQRRACRADVEVAPAVELELGPRERAVVPPAHIPNRDVWDDARAGDESQE